MLRIVIFKKNGVQAMVEFDSLDAATRARENLNGADIYAGCCTLKIDFAKVKRALIDWSPTPPRAITDNDSNTIINTLYMWWMRVF